MTREEVTAMVFKHVYEALPELRDTGLDPGKSYKEMGIDSLALLQVLTGSTKEMQVKIPRNELATLSTVNGLVELLMKAKSQPGA
jgi:acyl carrier protein